MNICRAIWLIILISLVNVCQAQVPWNEWLAQFKKEAIADGIRPEFFDRTLAGVTPMPRVLNFDRRQPEHRLTFSKYRATRADNYRIALGIKELARNRELLNEIGEHYGVDPCFIVTFWGMETSYGNYMGTFPVINALVTLAYDSRRGDVFRKELLIALHILQEGHVDPQHFKGEWAGGSGHPQFLPSSWQRYAVDYDNDGLRDIWRSKVDALASIANYLAQNGWQRDEPWAVTVDLPDELDTALLGKQNLKSVAEWRALGVTATSGKRLPEDSKQAAIIQPFGGPNFMIFNNFSVIKKYNNSDFYAGTIGYMADKICRRE